ncbi:MAG: EAL domain-containing protein [Solobacterium sp.]|nr:EAL domain-containing protein [Solobacterium sp.]
MKQHIHFASYSPAADIVVTAVCFVMIILVVFSNISKTRGFKLFFVLVGLVLGAAWTDITFYTLAADPKYQTVANWMRCIYHALLFLIFVYYIAYICEVTNYENQKPYLILANTIFFGVTIADIISTIQGPTFTVDTAGIHFIGRGIFFYGYIAFTLLCIHLMARVRKHLFHRVMFGFYGTMGVSFLVLLMQGMSGQSSFTVSTLMFPVIAMMYVLHSNPYDAALGSNDAKAMQDYVRYCYGKKQDFAFMSLYMKEFDEEGKDIPQDMQTSFREYVYKYLKKAKVFKVGKGHLILILPKKTNPNHEQIIQEALDGFRPYYEKHRYDYKIVVGENIDEISEKNDYVSYIRSIHRSMPECSVHRVGAQDVVQFQRLEYILSELADINRKRDLDDPRVLVYCQPVLNVKTGNYDTAEALMRLNLEQTGIVYPNDFIPLAEEQSYIHVLTEIILHKTCEAIKQFTEDGYEIKRISVNVSALELKDDNFCSDIIRIIRQSGIPGDKVAIELTESRNEGDFILMKEKIGELKQQGIKFYLDDFGTGYSNMERIMELPFDIIKFDRSLVIASGAETRSRKMVANLANMFSDMDYYVLYEGVEKDADEAMCRDMFATYLQGFKYSRPEPISDLKNYLNQNTMYS